MLDRALRNARFEHASGHFTRDRRLVIATSFFILIAVFNLITLESVAVRCDESWYGQAFWEWAQKGSFGTPMFEGIHGLERDSIIWGRLYIIAEGLAVKYLGLGIRQIRLPQALFMLINLVFLYHLTRRLYGERAAFWSIVLFGSSFFFFWQAHYARPEAMFLTFFLASLLLLLQGAKSENQLLFFLSGLAISLSAEIHMNGFVYTFIIFIVAVVLSKTSSGAIRNVLLFCLGTFTGIGLWVQSHMARDPELFIDQWLNVWSQNRLALGTAAQQPGIFLLDGPEFLRRLMLQLYGFLLDSRSALLYGASSFCVMLLVLILSKRSLRDVLRVNRLALVLLLLWAVTGALFTSNALEYGIVPMTIVAMILAELISSTSYEWPRPWSALAIRLLGIGLIVLGFVLSARMGITDKGSRYFEYCAELQRKMKPGSVVYGGPSLWLGFSRADQKFYALFSTELIEKDPDARKAILSRPPDYLIGGDPYASEIMNVISRITNRRAKKLATIHHEIYGYWTLGSKELPYTEIYELIPQD
jgi:4-amino-4-deoxy-L-arabinose transferase-like glycosyltransferase